MAGKQLTGRRAFHRLVALFIIQIVATPFVFWLSDISDDRLVNYGQAVTFAILAYGFVMLWQLERRS